ncbi:hypothetical protein CHUAL_014119 [Chamberlinius hualienensis]
METYSYLRSVIPLAFALGIAGLELFPRPSQPRSFRGWGRSIGLKILKFVHIFSLLTLVSYAVVLLKNAKTQLIGLMAAISFTFGTCQLITLRFIFGKNFQIFVNLSKKTEKLFKQFDGKEQLYLRRIRIFSKIVYFLQIYDLLQMSSVFILRFSQLTSAQKTELSVDETYGLVMLVMAFAIPNTQLFISALKATIWTHMLALLFIFRLLDNLSQSQKDNPIVTKRQLAKFIRIHRNACQLMDMTNRVFLYLLLTKMSGEIIMTLFFYVMYLNFNTGIFFISMANYMIISSVTIILTGLNNTMVYKSLEHCRKFVVGRRLSIYVELYEIHVKLRKPVITVGGIATLNRSAIFIVFDFIITYMALLHKKNEQPELKMQ